MTKQFLFLAAAAFALTACTAEDVVDDVATSTRNEIRFENVVNKLTRAEDLTNDDLQRFNVFGYYTKEPVTNTVFNNVRVTKDGSDWTYDNARYWIPGADYKFFAYSCGKETQEGEDACENVNASLNDGNFVITEFICDDGHQHDLIFATAEVTGQEDGNVNVPLQFGHILSKIKAKFTNEFPDEYTVKISDVKVTNIRNIGNYNSKTGWAEPTREEDSNPYVDLDGTLEVDSKLDDNGNKPSESTGSAYVLPFEYGEEEVVLSFNVDLLVSENLVMSKELTATFSPTWVAGTSYVYNIVISPDALNMQEIKFSVEVSVDEWGNDKGENVAIDKPEKEESNEESND